MTKGLAPTGVVFMGLIVALALIGIGYALFTDKLRVSGAVATASVNAAFGVEEVDEGLARGAPDGPTDNGVNEDLEAGGLEVAECFVRPSAITDAIAVPDDSITPADDVVAVRPSDFLWVLLRGAYPGYNCYADFTVRNVGSIPAKVNQPVIGPAPDPNVLLVEFLNCYETGVQIEPGEAAECTLRVQVQRGAQPNTIYRFGATICAYQWNVSGVIRCPIPVDIEPLPADLEPAPFEAAPAEVMEPVTTP